MKAILSVTLLFCLVAVTTHEISADIHENELQTRTITGKITSAEDSEGLPGVNVVIKGTSQGTVTDIEGSYSIEVANDGAVLVFSSVGYVQEEIAVGNQSVIDIVMTPDVTALEEIVVVGYGEQTKQTLTGAVEVVGDEAFKSQAINNPILSLQGQTPGLVVTRSSARPGNEDTDLTIRGVTSINDADVLYVIDGVISQKAEFNNMNPADIESITVLKDGSAAIYGSRAANGVLMITTKQGKGRMTVQYDGSYRLKTIGRRPATPSMSEYGQAFMDAVDGEGDDNYKQWASRDVLQGFIDEVPGYYQTGVDGWGDNGLMWAAPSDRFNDMYGDAYSHQHNLAISGSTDNTRYRISGNFSDDAGASKVYDGQKQLTFRLNLDQKLTNWMRVDVGFSHQNIKTSSPSTGFQANAVNNDPPIFPAQNPNGQWLANFEIGNKNSIAQTTDGGRQDVNNNITKVNLGLTVDFTKDFSFRGMASFRQGAKTDDKYVLSVPLYNWAGDRFANNVNGTSYYNSVYSDQSYQLYSGIFTYDKTFNADHHFKVMAGVQGELSNSSNIEARRNDFEDLGVYNLKLGTGVQTNTSDAANYGFYSYFGRINYDYKEKYLLELLGRSDGTSRFGDGYKWQSYFGASGGWVITEEDFLSSSSFLSYLKLKASWAEMGNIPSTSVIQNHGYVSQMTFGTLPFGVVPANQTTARVASITTNERTWERVIMTNVGLEFSMLNHKLTGAFDYFVKDNPNMLSSQEYIALLGGAAPATNIGHLKTKGWEAVIGWQDQAGNVNYGISANMGNSTNELISLEGAENWKEGLNNGSWYRAGYPLESYWMWETEGLFQSQEQVDAWYQEIGNNGGAVPSQGSANGLRPGDIIKKDLDGNGQILAVSDDGGDLKHMGDGQAHYVFGINTNLTWKGLDFTANFQGHLHQNVQRTGLLAYPFRRHWANQTPAFIGTMWTPENPELTNPRPTSQAGRADYNWEHNDFRLQDSKYIRLKTLIVGYTIPQPWADAISMQSVRIYFSGNDLWEVTSIDDGFDPENGASTQSAYPFMRSYALGLSVKF